MVSCWNLPISRTIIPSYERLSGNQESTCSIPVFASLGGFTNCPQVCCFNPLKPQVLTGLARETSFLVASPLNLPSCSPVFFLVSTSPIVSSCFVAFVSHSQKPTGWNCSSCCSSSTCFKQQNPLNRTKFHQDQHLITRVSENHRSMLSKCQFSKCQFHAGILMLWVTMAGLGSWIIGPPGGSSVPNLPTSSASSSGEHRLHLRDADTGRVHGQGARLAAAQSNELQGHSERLNCVLDRTNISPYDLSMNITILWCIIFYSILFYSILFYVIILFYII